MFFFGGGNDDAPKLALLEDRRTAAVAVLKKKVMLSVMNKNYDRRCNAGRQANQGQTKANQKPLSGQRTQVVGELEANVDGK